MQRNKNSQICYKYIGLKTKDKNDENLSVVYVNVDDDSLLVSSGLIINISVVDVEEDDFNEGIILPPLIIQLRKILDQYPDDSQILKVGF